MHRESKVCQQPSKWHIIYTYHMVRQFPVIRKNVDDVKAGVTLDLHRYIPKTNSEIDIAAHKRQEQLQNNWFSDPVLKGTYPQELVDYLGDNLKDIDLDEISDACVPLDFVGINYYMLNRVQHADDTHELKTRIVPDKDATLTEMGWEVYPQGLFDSLMLLTLDYQVPAIYITENGAAYQDTVEDGAVHDVQRVDYYYKHLSGSESN